MNAPFDPDFDQITKMMMILTPSMNMFFGLKKTPENKIEGINKNDIMPVLFSEFHPSKDVIQMVQ